MELEFLPPSSKQETKEVRLLTPEEIQTLAPIFAEAGSTLPNPAVSQIVGCVESGEVTAFLVLELKLHAEPMWIKEGHSHTLPALVKEAESVIITRVGAAWVYLFAPAGRVAQLAQTQGMRVEPFVVLSKLVMPEVPTRTAIDLQVPSIEPQMEQVN
jgi:hypothetical protein